MTRSRQEYHCTFRLSSPCQEQPDICGRMDRCPGRGSRRSVSRGSGFRPSEGKYLTNEYENVKVHRRKRSPTIRRFERAFIQPFGEIFTKVQFGPGPAVKRSSYYTEIISPFLYAFAGIFLRFSNLFSLSGKMASYYTDKNRRFLRGFFEKFTNYSKTHRRRKVIPLLYAEKYAAFTAISRKIFHFSLLCLPSGKRSSYYTQKKQAFCVGVFKNVYKKFKNTPSPETVPTIRIKDKRFGKVFFGKMRKASHLFPLRRAICTPSLFFLMKFKLTSYYTHKRQAF